MPTYASELLFHWSPGSAVPSPTPALDVWPRAQLSSLSGKNQSAAVVTWPRPVFSLVLGLRSYRPLWTRLLSAFPLAKSYSIFNHWAVYFMLASPTISQEFCQPSVEFFFSFFFLEDDIPAILRRLIAFLSGSCLLCWSCPLTCIKTGMDLHLFCKTWCSIWCQLTITWHMTKIVASVQSAGHPFL
jgi:hypothetical protein